MSVTKPKRSFNKLYFLFHSFLKHHPHKLSSVLSALRAFSHINLKHICLGRTSLNTICPSHLSSRYILILNPSSPGTPKHYSYSHFILSLTGLAETQPFNLYRRTSSRPQISRITAGILFVQYCFAIFSRSVLNCFAAIYKALENRSFPAIFPYHMTDFRR